MKHTPFDIELCGSINARQLPPNWEPLVRHLELGVWLRMPSLGYRIDYSTANITSFSQWFGEFENLETLRIRIFGGSFLINRKGENQDQEILQIFSSIRTKAKICFELEYGVNLTEEGKKTLLDLHDREEKEAIGKHFNTVFEHEGFAFSRLICVMQ
ncbi:hypothetical protein EV356DRAFT_548175 [Viridothelium virens]|uniref:Uncharacterized protein n=1 Tax=Viridothelium virens TaxID=1048519 RepID=A0A6A6H6G7_VIRVR|nr:hypothetical protein EV356DRAFT_548175 [Viridothelium virens]